VPDEAVEAALFLAEDPGLVTILNPAPTRSFPSKLLEKVYVLTPNEVQLSHMAGVDVGDPEALPSAARKLLAGGGRNTWW